MEVLRQAAGHHPALPGIRRLNLAYFPFDRPTIMRQAVDSVRPRVVVLLESEIWPGLLAQLKARGGRCLIVNGRMTPRSLRRYRIWPSIWRALRPERVLAVSPADGARFAALFGPAGITVVPNLKFDQMQVGAAPRAAVSGDPAAVIAQGPLVVLGSIRRAEENQVLRIIRRLRQAAPEAVIGLFPRHAHRQAAWQKRLRRAGIPWVQRSGVRAPVSPGSIILWDGFGELAAAYGRCRAAFVGGSLAPLGGQNFLEALNGGVRPVIGPHWTNFAWVGRDLVSAGWCTRSPTGRRRRMPWSPTCGSPQREVRSGSRPRPISGPARAAPPGRPGWCATCFLRKTRPAGAPRLSTRSKQGALEHDVPSDLLRHHPGALRLLPFPGKPLVPILGKPMFWHVYQRARGCPALSRVVLATDDPRIAAAARQWQVPVVMTRSDHPSGTDRVLEAAEQLGVPEDAVVVNIQGDEPALEPSVLTALLAPFEAPGTRVSTLARKLDPEEAANPDRVKVVFGVQHQALYFSRAPIPFARDGQARQPRYGHIGLYAFRLEALRQFVALGPSPLETTEKLEQLRLLENGIPIQVVFTRHRSIGVDRPEDLAAVTRLLTEAGPRPDLAGGPG